jgi:signal peptidase I
MEKTTSAATPRKTWKENLVSLVFALVLVFAVRSTLFESFKIPSGSMIPTLAIGDYIFVNKLAYGIKIPFTEWFLEEPIYLYRRDLPKRGDIIVFRYPRDESIYFIKRLVGVPGDVIELRDRVLHVNGKPVARDPMPAADQARVVGKGYTQDPQYTVNDPDLFTEHLPASDGGAPVDHMMMVDKSNGAGRSFGPVTVPKDSFFAMGDNLDVSNDSRFWGFVPMKNVSGRATFVWFSFWAVELMAGNIYFHPERIGTVIR